MVASKQHNRRRFLQKAAGGIVALVSMALPFGIARLLMPATFNPPNSATADKSKRNIIKIASRNTLRPPGALSDDQAFVSACIACGLCGEICPARCIKFYKNDGGANANTPYIDAAEKACILCNKCMEVCPTMALTEMPRHEIDMGLAQIDRAACYPWVDQGICGACVSICPIGDKAISFKQWNQYRPIIHDGCVGCGLCVEICPHPSTPIWIIDRKKGSVASQRV